MVDHVPADAVLAGGGGGGGGGGAGAPAAALVAHPAGAPARVIVAAVAGALQLPVEHQLVEGGPAPRYLIGLRGFGV